MKNVRAARRYALALMSAAAEQQALDDVTRDLEAIGTLLRGSRELRLLLDSPVVRPARKNAILTEIFGARICRATGLFLRLLVTKGREALLADIVEQYAALRDDQMGVVNVHVTGAVALSGPQQAELRAQLERFTGKTVRLHTAVDPSVRAGLLVRIGDTVVDATVRRQLERLRRLFTEGTPAAA